MAKLTDGIDSCPFCGGLHFVVFGNKDEGGISCACGASIRCKTEPEFYELVVYDLHRKVPAHLGLEIAKERWNRRANADVRPAPTCANAAMDYSDCDQFVCSSCGIELQDWRKITTDEDGEEQCSEFVFRFCPNCGKKVEVGDG